MTRDEAEQAMLVVEAGLGEHYGITRSQYAEALLVMHGGIEQAAVANRLPTTEIAGGTDEA